jgi:hypothetical protein
MRNFLFEKEMKVLVRLWIMKVDGFLSLEIMFGRNLNMISNMKNVTINLIGIN